MYLLSPQGQSSLQSFGFIPVALPAKFTLSAAFGARILARHHRIPAGDQPGAIARLAEGFREVRSRAWVWVTLLTALAGRGDVMDVELGAAAQA